MSNINQLNFAVAGEGKVNVALQNITINMQKVERASRNASNGMRRLTAGSKQLQSTSGTLSKGIAGIGKSLFSAYLGITLFHRGISETTKFVTEGVKKYREFEKQIAEISTIASGDAYSSMVMLEQGIISLSTSYGKSANDLAKGTYDILSAAVDVSDAFNLLTTSTRAAIAGVSDVSTSVDVMTSILNAYGYSVEEMTLVSDKLFQTIIRGKLVFNDLANAMGYIAPIAANLGVELEEVLAALSTVTRQGLHADMATRGLALAIQNFADMTPAAEKAAAKYGVTINETMLSVGGLSYVIDELRAATEKYGMGILPEIVRNMRSLRVVMALLGDEGVTGFAKDMEYLDEATGKTEEAMSKMMSTTERMASVLDEATNAAQRMTGDALSVMFLELDKIKLWWATFIGEGFDFGKAGEAVSTIDEIMGKARQAMLETMALGDKTVDDVGMDVLAEKVGRYGEIQEEKRKLAEIGTVLGGSQAFDTMSPGQKTLSGGLLGLPKLDKTLTGEQLNEVNEFVAAANAELENIGVDVKLPTLGASALFDSNQYSSWKNLVDEAYDGVVDAISKLSAEESGLVEYNNLLIGSLKELDRQYAESESNIVKITRALKEVREEIADLNNEISSSVKKTALDMFKEYSSMTLNYGDTFDSSYFQDMKDAAISYNGSLSDAIGGTKWYNKEVWENVRANNGYSDTLTELVNELGTYQAKEEKLNETLEKSADIIDDLNQKVKVNNLEIAKLNLKEMIHRGRLSRGDENRLNKLRISNAEERIKIMEEEISIQETGEQKKLNNASDAYSKLKSMYDEYIDRWNFALSSSSTVAAQELADIQALIDAKIAEEQGYTSFLETELERQNMLYWDAFQKRLSWARSDPTSYKETLGEESYENTTALSASTMSRTPYMLGVYNNLNRLTDGFFGKRVLGGFATGTNYVPRTGIYQLHEGEAVVPKHKNDRTQNISKTTVNPNITINMNVYNNDDLETLGMKVQELVYAGTIGGVNTQYE